MAVENRYHIQVSTKSKMFGAVPEIVANDNVVFEIELYDGATLFPLLPEYTYQIVSLKKASGTSVIRSGAAVGGLLVFDLGSSEMTDNGKVEATVQVFDVDNNRVSAAKFDYMVRLDPSLQGSFPTDDKTLVVANESLLTDAIAKSEEQKQRVDDLIAGTTQPSEVVDARGGKAVLRDRLDAVDAYLADISINVKSLGAKTDGTDATSFFTQARAKSKFIFVPEGTYIVDNLSLQDAVLFGNGTLKWKANSATFMLELKGRCLVEGLTLDGNGPNQTITTDAIKLTTADNTTVRNNLFTNFKGKLIVSDLANSNSVQILNNRFENCGTVTGCDIVTVRSSDWLISGNYFSTIGDGHSIRLGLYNGDATTNAVERTIISNNHFKDTQHVGVTCEIYTRNTVITGNTFDNLEQAVKMEIAGATVYDITVTNNIFRNITLSTALNLVGTKVKFTNNRCYNITGSVLFSEYYDCSHNEFYDCGVASTNEVITVTGSPLHGIVAKNLIVNPKYRAISVFGGTITGNRIINCPDQAIRISDSGVITDNYVNGATNGVVLVSTTSNSIVSNNVFIGITSTVISFTNNASFNTVFIKENVGAALADLTYTLASDAFTISMSARTVRVGSEGAAATDNLATINGGFIGQTIFLRAVTTTQAITVQDKVGNIDLSGSSFVLNSANDILQLVWNGTYWCEVSRSDNG